MKIARIYDDNGQSQFTDIDISLNPTEPYGGVSGFRASAPFSAEQCFFFSSPQCVQELHVGVTCRVVQNCTLRDADPGTPAFSDANCL